jgi:hypothetical protein
MPLSWTEPWELPAQWRPAPAREAAPERAVAGQPEGGDIAEPDDSQDLFPDPWPAYGVLRFSPDDGMRVAALGPSGDPFAVPTGTFALWGETLVHHDVRAADVREGDELTLLLQRLVMVLQVNIMLDLGWSEAGAGGFLRRSYEGQRVLLIADEES